MSNRTENHKAKKNSLVDFSNHRYRRSDSKYFVKGYFYELWIDTLEDSSTRNGRVRISREYYNIGIYYSPLTISNNNNTKLRLINLGINNNKLIEINDENILYARKLLCNDLTKALRQVDLKGADLKGANLEGVNLEGADLEGANLDEANLEGADLKKANLKDAKLKGANLRKADLIGANLEGANIIGAIIDQTKAITNNNRGHGFIIPDRFEYTQNTQLQRFSLGGGGVKNEYRFFKLVSINGKEVDGGRYKLPAKTKSGKAQTRGPKDKASTAFSEICKKNNKKEECSYKFEIQETTQGSNKKVYKYEGKRKKLAKPITLELKDKKTGKVTKIVKKYKNVVVAL